MHLRNNALRMLKYCLVFVASIAGVLFCSLSVAGSFRTQNAYYDGTLYGGVSSENPRSIHVPDRARVKQELSGRVFSRSSSVRNDRYVSGHVTTGVLYSFSRRAEEHLQQMFADVQSGSPVKEIRVISPTITWYGGKLHVLMRVWLNLEEHYDAANDQEKVRNSANSWEDNYLYVQTFDSYMNLTEPGWLLGIPVPKQFVIAGGTGDARFVTVAGRTLLSFYLTLFYRGESVGHTFLWDYAHRTIHKPTVPGYRLNTIDSNWAPFDLNGTLHYVYTFEPLRILRCDRQTTCSFVYRQDSTTAKAHETKGGPYTFNPWKEVLRGGSQLELYHWPYYVGLVHSKVTPDGATKSLYGAHVVLLRVHPTYHVTMVSEPIRFHPALLSSTRLIRHTVIARPFVFPVGLLIESQDSFVVSAHVNDCKAFLFRITGLKGFLEKAIAADKEIWGSRSQSKENLRVVRKSYQVHDYSRKSLMQFLGMKESAKRTAENT